MCSKILKNNRSITYLSILRNLKQAEREIGYKLAFKQIPNFWIDGLMRCDMTRTWKASGLKISRGANYFTVGKIKNGVSSRFTPEEREYQSWLGGYTVRLKEAGAWTLQDHLNLAVPDQRSWLKRYGDPSSLCEMQEGDFRNIGSLSLGRYSGALYEGCCTTHSDVGDGFANIWLRLSAIVMAMAFNEFNPVLNLLGKMLRPKNKGRSYETLKLEGYIAIFDIDKYTKVVLYGVGAKSLIENNLKGIKDEIFRAFESCEIIKV